MPDTVLSKQFRDALLALARRRVPSADAEDLVQQVLLEALAAPQRSPREGAGHTRPTEPEALRKWIYGILRNKAVDRHRRARREVLGEIPDVPDSAPLAGEADLLRWATARLPPGVDQAKTFEWLLREGEGEKLEAIAEAENLPAPRVRQRVSRLRKHFREHWQAELGILAALGVVAGIWMYLARKPNDGIPVIPDSPIVEAERLRKEAFPKCASGDAVRCLDGLDRARNLDPAGDARDAVQEARKQAARSLVPSAPPSATVSAPIPSASVLPKKPAPTAPFSTAVPRMTPTPLPQKNETKMAPDSKKFQGKSSM